MSGSDSGAQQDPPDPSVTSLRAVTDGFLTPPGWLRPRGTAPRNPASVRRWTTILPSIETKTTNDMATTTPHFFGFEGCACGGGAGENPRLFRSSGASAIFGAAATLIVRGDPFSKISSIRLINSTSEGTADQRPAALIPS